jgi:WD40 repeat protein/predicted Ser/Thr protein kinase
VGNAEDDRTSRSAILTIPGRPEALREGPSAKNDAEAGASERADVAGHLPNGATLGRYVVTGCVGTGGMGVVYSARDPDLDRRVALKVLRPELSVEPGSRARLLREARAMAQLSHPNVVPIYDVGVLGDQVFIAMELVDGVTLRHKLDRKTPWRTVLRTYLQAARGLAAAHAAGLVHRDFKPDNVLCGNDGRIRVVDFGLVSVDAIELAPPSFQVLGSGLDPTVETTAGAVLGTPAYMAPEAMRGELTDARADQFSFCVALFHELYGVYPHTGDTLAERAEQIARGAIARPVGSAVPDRVYRVLVRGLCARPESRYRSMEALANALEHAMSPRQRPRMVVLGATGAVVIGALVAFALVQGGSKPPPPLFDLDRPETIARGDASQLAVTMLRDGRYLRVEHGIVTVIAANGVSERALTTPDGLMPTRVRPSSIDGQAEVYATGVPCSWWLVPVDGGPWRSLLEDPSCASEVDLSPDGTQLAFTRGGELHIRNLATGAERTLLHKVYGPAAREGSVPSWSPDGTRLVVSGEISIVDVNSGRETHYGRVGAAACWLDVDHIAYVTKTWFHNEIHLIDLRTGTDRMVLETEGATFDLAASRGGLLVRRDEFHSQVYIVAASETNLTSLEQLPQLDTGSVVDFIPAVWTPDGAVITLALVAGKRGLMQTVPGQRGTPLALHRARDIVLLGSTQQQVIYSVNDGGDCELRVFDLGTRKDQFWRNLRCAQKPNITCAWSPSRCIVIDDAGPRWFDPSSMQFIGPVSRFEQAEILSPDATMSVRVRGTAVVRNLASGVEDTVELPAADGPIYIGWGSDSSTLLAITTSPGHHRMLVRSRDGHWRTIIDEPHRSLNGYAVSPDGSRVAFITHLSASTWSYLPFNSPLRK